MAQPEDPNTNDLKDIERRLSDLDKVLKTHIETGPQLDEKAWNILRFTGAIFGVAIAIITLNKDSLDQTYLAIGLLVAFVVQLLQMWFLWEAIRPKEYRIPPGNPTVPKPIDLSYEDFFKTYINVELESYLGQLLVDYMGNEAEAGAIQQAQEVNQRKAKALNKMTLSLFVIFIVLLATLMVSVILPSQEVEIPNYFIWLWG